MNKIDKNTNSGSDDSDDDYVPDAKTGNVSEEEESGDAESDVEGCDEPKSKRRRGDFKIQNDSEVKAKKVEESKIDVDSLWADFKKDTEDITSKRSQPEPIPAATIPKSAVPVTKPTQVVQPSPRPGGSGGSGMLSSGMSSLLKQLGKKDKLSTLEKSRLDWNNFKRAEGIDEDLQKHNRGKGGFLEKRDFLERADLRQYEIEKTLRKTSNR